MRIKLGWFEVIFLMLMLFSDVCLYVGHILLVESALFDADQI